MRNEGVLIGVANLNERWQREFRSSGPQQGLGSGRLVTGLGMEHGADVLCP